MPFYFEIKSQINMKNKSIILSALVLFSASFLFMAFTYANKSEGVRYEFMQFTTIERTEMEFNPKLSISGLYTYDKVEDKGNKQFLHGFSIYSRRERANHIASDDKIIAEKITELSTQGWDLAHVTSGVTESKIFITRYLF